MKADLQAARTLVEKGWAQHAEARTADSRRCRVDWPTAKLFDATGAIRRALLMTSRSHLFYDVIEALNLALPLGQSLLAYNDDPRTTKDDVLRLFDRAIAIQENENAAAPD